MHTGLHHIARMRCKLSRWNLQGLPGPTTSRFLKALKVVKKHLPPKVSSAVLRCAWNGWCTERRFQGSGRCLFNCGAFWQADSLEHYASCSVCVRFLRQHLHYTKPVNRGHLITLGANTCSQSEEDTIRLALWVFALYKSFNHLRHRKGPTLSADELDSLMLTFLQDGVTGKDASAQFLSNCWHPGASL